MMGLLVVATPIYQVLEEPRVLEGREPVELVSELSLWNHDEIGFSGLLLCWF